MPSKTSKIQQKYLDEAQSCSQTALEDRLEANSNLRLVLITLSLLKDCCKYGFIKMID